MERASAPSVPGLGRRWRCARAVVGVSRGSTTIIRAPRSSRAWMSRALWTLAWKGLMLHNSSKSALETSASAWWPYTSRWAISMAEWQELASVR